MDTPKLYRIQSANNNYSLEALIIIRGMRSESNFDDQKQVAWCNYLRNSGYQGAIYYLWWDSGNPININYLELKNRADKVGNNYFYDLVINGINESEISFIGHSLGCRVIYSGLKNVSKFNFKPINNIILLAGAISRKKDWERLASKLKGKLVNVYNPNDDILNNWYLIGQSLGGNFSMVSPCGVHPIEISHPQIINHNIANFIRPQIPFVTSTSHNELDYLDTLSQTVGQILWKQSPYNNLTIQNKDEFLITPPNINTVAKNIHREVKILEKETKESIKQGQKFVNDIIDNGIKFFDDLLG